jgi:N-acetylglucosaminyl-diphospho-decaprenol L-rhamnosyltransferase
MDARYQVPVIIVGFRNPDDVTGCLRAVARMAPEPSMEVFIAENGGPEAFDRLAAAVTAKGGPCIPAPAAENGPASSAFRRLLRLRLVGPDGTPGAFVNLAEAPGNLGYAGGVNAWMRPLMAVPGWEAAWVLNPDTAPEPDALSQLASYSRRRGKGMVGSRLVLMAEPDRVQTRGLCYRPFRAVTLAVDRYALSSHEPDPDDVERRLDSPSGASIYATRPLIEQIGLMDERYFLYFEDLDWGRRAKKAGAVGYAHQSIVFHKGGSTIGTATRRADKSRLAVYLEARNRILFVKENYPGWLGWTVLVNLVRIASFAVARAFPNVGAASRGLVAGLLGEYGAPTRLDPAR